MSESDTRKEGSIDVTDLEAQDLEDSNDTPLRDSAILLGGVTALLYLTSHIYGAAYLNTFGVNWGFQPLGLDHLAMMDLGFIVAMAVYTYYVFDAVRDNKFWVVVSLVIVAVTARIVTDVVFGAVTTFGLTVAALTLCGWAAMFLVVQVVLVRVREAKKRLRERATNLASETPKSLTEPSYVLRALKRTRWRLTAISWLMAGYTTAIIVVPSLAYWAAIGSAQRDRFVALDNGKRMVPVYSIGDRVVYMTFDTGCFVHTQIDNVEQSKRRCPETLEAMVNLPQLPQGFQPAITVKP